MLTYFLLDVYLLVMAEWTVLAPDVSAGSLEQQQLHSIVNGIHPPLVKIADSAHT